MSGPLSIFHFCEKKRRKKQNPDLRIWKKRMRWVGTQSRERYPRECPKRKKKGEVDAVVGVRVVWFALNNHCTQSERRFNEVMLIEATINGFGVRSCRSWKCVRSIRMRRFLKLMTKCLDVILLNNVPIDMIYLQTVDPLPGLVGDYTAHAYYSYRALYNLMQTNGPCAYASSPFLATQEKREQM
ncbi:hypothetical protein P167DRAFT_548673 [Morchella conica CCBAS932]|uniref:Uncharacterized protein n=1 Tax=Morchella conica CCBAS932 TaxID=1392247 RepID=A0A3N4KE10_9PEZI|nr:hypothetical protein P167DRAFT_548673 [Morchella conica CCBAS932]